MIVVAYEMCDRIPQDYALRTADQYAYVTTDGQFRISAVVAEVWDIFPMPDNLRDSNEREAVIGTNYSLRPYNATIDGLLWTEGNSPNGDRIKIYFSDYNNQGLPLIRNRMTIPYDTAVRNMDILASVDMFGLAYQDRLFLCMLSSCIAEEQIDQNGLPSIRCKDYFVNQVDNSSHDQIAISRFCDREDPDDMCIDLCSKTRDTTEQCQSILYTRCSNSDYARENPDICGCHLPTQVYRDYLDRLRQSINNLDDRYAAIKSILQLVEYDPANPQCFYPSCITAQYKGINSNTGICPDFTVCFQGIDLTTGNLTNTELNLLNECLINRDINPGIQPDPQPTPQPNPQTPVPNPVPRPPTPTPSNGKKGKDKNSTITWIAISGGILLLLLVVGIAIGASKKGSKK